MRATRGRESVFVDCGFPPAEAETIDTLVNMLTAAGLKVDVDITARRPGAKNKRVV
jgi:predicted XRE-type DNA-binding protein